MPTTPGPVLVIGASGMLARAFAELLTKEGVSFSAIDLPEIDLTDEASVERCVTPQWRTVLNCAAFTDVDGSETREALANAINGSGVTALARRCAATGATLVHYSTDYVFDGVASEPYRVDQARAPLNAYGRSKALGEQGIEQAGGRYLLIRTSWLYAPWGKNFVLTMRRLMQTQDLLKVVRDQVGRPTSAQYLAERSIALLRAAATGTFHVTDGGQCSWHEFAVRIGELIGAKTKVEPCTSAEFARDRAALPVPARRPAYSVLDITKTDALLGPSRDWQSNLADVLAAVPAD
jgi:dTDP-4-dehydrorhamnose reductase